MSAYHVYTGTFTAMPPHGRGTATGIGLLRLETATGHLTPIEMLAGVDNPSFVALHPTRPLLYSVNAVPEHDGRPGGSVSAFAIEPVSGRLTFLNRQSSHGAGPCHVSVDPSGAWVYSANYGGGSIAMLPVLADGRLGPASCTVQHTGRSVNAERQTGPHAHSLTLDPAGRFALVCDLGLDRVLVYRIDRQHGQLVPHEPPAVASEPGAGPRHLDIHPSGRSIYVINELASTVTTYAYAAEAGRLTPLQTLSTLPADFSGNNSTADIHVDPSGRFVYGSNRGHDSLAVFAIDPTTGTLTARGHVSTGGQTPRHFKFDPSGRFLFALNQDGHNIVTFGFDAVTGALTPTGAVVSTPSPVCLVFRPQ